MGYYLSPHTGARFYISRYSEWGKELAADGYVWVEEDQD